MVSLKTSYTAGARRGFYKLGVILAGAVGNLIDRIVYGEVIDFLDVQVNPKTDGQIVRAMMPNPNETLTDGQTVRVVIVQEATSKVVAIPKSAIAVDQSGAYVFIVNDKNVVVQRRVKLRST